MTIKDLAPWLTLAAMLLAAGLYLGRLESRITVLERDELFLHGDVSQWVKR